MRISGKGYGERTPAKPSYGVYCGEDVVNSKKYKKRLFFAFIR